MKRLAWHTTSEAGVTSHSRQQVQQQLCAPALLRTKRATPQRTLRGGVAPQRNTKLRGPEILSTRSTRYCAVIGADPSG